MKRYQKGAAAVILVGCTVLASGLGGFAGKLIAEWNNEARSR